MMTNTMPLVQEKKHITWKKVPIIHMPFYLLEQNLKIHMIMKNAIALETIRNYFSVHFFFLLMRTLRIKQIPPYNDLNKIMIYDLGVRFLSEKDGFYSTLKRVPESSWTPEIRAKNKKTEKKNVKKTHFFECFFFHFCKIICLWHAYYFFPTGSQNLELFSWYRLLCA